MARTNKSAVRAQREKNDEFYTRLDDIESEVVHYKDQLRGRIIYCPTMITGGAISRSIFMSISKTWESRC